MRIIQGTTQKARCEGCALNFEYVYAKTPRKFCSSACRSRVHEQRYTVTVICKHCSKSFRARQRRTYCSAKCSGKDYTASLVARSKSRRIYPENGLNAQKNHYRAHRERILAKDKDKRKSLVRLLGGKCISCGYSDLRALVLDHRRSDGYIDRKRIGNKIARYYINHLDEARMNLQVLCANCNLIKQSEANEHNRTRRIA